MKSRSLPKRRKKTFVAVHRQLTTRSITSASRLEAHSRSCSPRCSKGCHRGGRPAPRALKKADPKTDWAGTNQNLVPKLVLPRLVLQIFQIMKNLIALFAKAYGWLICGAGFLKSPLLLVIRLYWGWQSVVSGHWAHLGTCRHDALSNFKEVAPCAIPGNQCLHFRLHRVQYLGLLLLARPCIAPHYDPAHLQFLRRLPHREPRFRATEVVKYFQQTR